MQSASLQASHTLQHGTLWDDHDLTGFGLSADNLDAFLQCEPFDQDINALFGRSGLEHCTTLLHYVCEGNDCAAAKKLLEGGADPLIADERGETPLQHALEEEALTKSSRKLCQLLLHGIKKGKLAQFLVTGMPAAGCSPLELAYRLGMWWAVKSFHRVVSAADVHSVLARVCSAACSVTLAQVLKHVLNAPPSRGSEDIHCAIISEVIKKLAFLCF